MPLILAIEPDRKQAGQLTAMVRGRLHAELVLGDSAERALAALGQRIPDLVLTSALLSPKDETALGERLRALDGAAAHVQTLTIPVLAAPSRGAVGRAGGVLSALRREKGKASSAPDGCDPAVFADQCKEYLERAAAEREALLEQAAAQAAATREPARAPAVPSPVTGSEWVVVKEEEPIAASDSVMNEFAADESATHAASSFIVDPPQPAYESYAAPSDYDARSVDVAPEPEPVVPPEPPPAAKQERKRRSRTKLKEDGDGPASLLAAVAALEAETEQTLIAESYAIPDEPVVRAVDVVETVDPVAEATTAHAVEHDYGAGDQTGEDDETADELDLSSLLQPSTPSARPRQYGGFSEVPADVYELDLDSIGSPLEFQQEAQIEQYPPPSTQQPLSVPILDAMPAVDTGSKTPRNETRSWPVLEDLLEGLTTTTASPTAPPAAAPTASQPEHRQQWADIVEALRRDAEQLQAAPQKAPAAPEPEPIPLVDAMQPKALEQVVETAAQEPEAAKTDDPNAENGAAAAKRKKRRSRGNPAQDEWGFFDPEQCGFAALIEKLEEITDDDPPTPRRA
jgi:hypothetical protein